MTLKRNEIFSSTGFWVKTELTQAVNYDIIRRWNLINSVKCDLVT